MDRTAQSPACAEAPNLAHGFALLDAMPLGVVVMKVDGEIVHANPEFRQVVGFDGASVAGQNVNAFLPTLLPSRVHTKGPGAPSPDDCRDASRIVPARRADGAEHFVAIALAKTDIFGDASLLATVTPVAQASAGFGAFRDVFDHAPYGLALVALDGTIRRANARLCAMFAYTSSELEGEPVEALVPHRVRSGHGALRRAYSAHPTPRSTGEGRYLTGRRRDGVEFPVEIGLWSVATEAGPMICASVIDVTLQKRSEHRLREANEQLEEFTYVAAHDLRSPMRGIANLIEFVLEDYGDAAPEGVLTNIRRMQDRVASMERLIDDLLVYARASKGDAKFELIDLSAMIDDVLSVNAPPAGLRLNVEIRSTPFEGARTPLLTTIRNLFSNAIKHHDREEMEIGIKSCDEGDFVIIDITDDGPGIPAVAQQRVFKLFQTLAASPKREGGGIGLAVARRLVTQHGGRLELISADGRRGCTFRIWWPRLKRTDYDA